MGIPVLCVGQTCCVLSANQLGDSYGAAKRIS